MKLVISILSASLLVYSLNAQENTTDKSQNTELLKAKLTTLETEMPDEDKSQPQDTVQDTTQPDNNQQNIQNTEDENEYKYIQPIAIEEAPLVLIDSDGDGVYDDKDQCPDTKKGAKVDATGCEILLDSDGDGVTNNKDKCPTTPKGRKVDVNGCELDSDGDGVVDSNDQCPNTSKEFMVDGYGCPQTATLHANFASNSYALTNNIIESLKEFAGFLTDNPGYQVIIYGYTDNTGDAEKNRVLSQNRANSIKEGLRRYGINVARMTSIGKGALDPIADNNTKEGRAKNRRIEAELIK